MKLKGYFAAAVGTIIVLSAAGVAIAQSELIVYPAKGQSETKMGKDKTECQSWAAKQSGVDPAAHTQQAAAAETGPKGERLKGGARGAAGGAAIGAIAGDAGKGAEIGAVAGGMRGGMEERREKRAERAAEAKAEQVEAQDKGTFNRAYAACLEGRGYTVK